MQTLSPILLNEGWNYFFSDHTGVRYDHIDPQTLPWIPLHRLSDWMLSSSAHRGADWFWRVLTLETHSASDRMILKIDRVPEHVHVYVNGSQVGTARCNRAFAIDVAPYLVRGDNDILLQLVNARRSNGGRFHDILLQPEFGGIIARAH